METCHVCHHEEPVHLWDPIADRYMCMYPVDAVPQPHWIPICNRCHSIIMSIPNEDYRKSLLRLARRQRRKNLTQKQFKKVATKK